MVAEERFDHVCLVAFEAALEHRSQAAAPIAVADGGRQGKERDERRIGEVSWQQEAAGPRRGKFAIRLARSLQIAREKAGAVSASCSSAAALALRTAMKASQSLAAASRCGRRASSTARSDHSANVSSKSGRSISHSPG